LRYIKLKAATKNQLVGDKCSSEKQVDESEQIFPVNMKPRWWKKGDWQKLWTHQRSN